MVNRTIHRGTHWAVVLRGEGRGGDDGLAVPVPTCITKDPSVGPACGLCFKGWLSEEMDWTSWKMSGRKTSLSIIFCTLESHSLALCHHSISSRKFWLQQRCLRWSSLGVDIRFWNYKKTKYLSIFFINILFSTSSWKLINNERFFSKIF